MTKVPWPCESFDLFLSCEPLACHLQERRGGCRKHVGGLPVQGVHQVLVRGSDVALHRRRQHMQPPADQALQKSACNHWLWGTVQMLVMSYHR